MNRRQMGTLCLVLALGALGTLGAGSASAQVRGKLTPGDVYCSGMFTREAVPADMYMVSGEESHVQTIYGQGDYVFINKGSSGGVKVGDHFQVMRKTKTPSHIKWFDSQPVLLRAMGQQWEDLALLRAVHVDANTSTAIVERACDFLQRGDIVRPFAERPVPPLRAWDRDRFRPATGKAQGMVVMAKDYAQEVGAQSVIYINVGNAQGAKVGDYVNIFRYQGTRHETVYQLRHTAYEMWGFGKTPVPYYWKDLPREYLGEGVVLSTSENAATVYISYSLRQIYQGDYIELDNPAPPMAEPAPPPAPMPANRPPSVTCSAERASVMQGESVRVMARASDPDNDRLVITWFANAGRITPGGDSATWSSAGLAPGRYTINAQANDGHNAAADCAAYVEVMAPAAPAQPSKVGECSFAAGSSRVDNVCKRYLDDLAVRLKNDPRGHAELIGYADPAESGAASLGTNRANAARAYLQTSGIATSRVDAKSAGGQQGAGKANRRLDLIWVPSGGSM